MTLDTTQYLYIRLFDKISSHDLCSKAMYQFLSVPIIKLQGWLRWPIIRCRNFPFNYVGSLQPLLFNNQKEHELRMRRN